MNAPELQWVFSYGSNSSVQLKARVKNPNLRARPAFVEDWARIFCLRSNHWQGAVASLAPAVGKRTYGGAVQLTQRELSLLDQYEQAYTKVDIDITVVIDVEHTTVKGIAYIAKSPDWTVPPSEHYLTAIHLNLREQWGEDEMSITVSGLLQPSENGMEVLSIYDWEHPGSHALSLPALCVEVNALKSEPWVMPRTITEIRHKLQEVNIGSAAQLAVALSSHEKVEKLNKNLTEKGHKAFGAETISLFQQVLGITHHL